MEVVQKNMCAECLFSKNKNVTDKQKEEILKECKENLHDFICPKSEIAGGHVICRGFYQEHTNSAISKLFENAGFVNFVVIE